MNDKKDKLVLGSDGCYVDDINAGKPCASCQKDSVYDSCLSAINITIISPNTTDLKRNIRLTGKQYAKLYAIDQSFGVKLIGSNPGITLFRDKETIAKEEAKVKAQTAKAEHDYFQSANDDRNAKLELENANRKLKDAERRQERIEEKLEHRTGDLLNDSKHPKEARNKDNEFEKAVYKSNEINNEVEKNKKEIETAQKEVKNAEKKVNDSYKKVNEAEKKYDQVKNKRRINELKFNLKEDKFTPPPEIEIKILGKCPTTKETCPSGLFTQLNTQITDTDLENLNFGHLIANSIPEIRPEADSKFLELSPYTLYKEEVPYAINKAVLDFNPLELIAAMFNKRDIVFDQFFSNFICRYSMMVDKRHPPCNNDPFKVDGLFVVRNKMHSNIAFDLLVVPTFGFKIELSLSNYQNFKVNLTEKEMSALNEQLNTNGSNTLLVGERPRDFNAKSKSYNFGVTGSIKFGKNEFVVDASGSKKYLSRSYEKLLDKNLITKIASKIVEDPKKSKTSSGKSGLLPKVTIEKISSAAVISLASNLATSSDARNLGMDVELFLKAGPLIGFKITADLIDAFLTYFHIFKKPIVWIREQLEKNPYLKYVARCDLSFSIQFNLVAAITRYYTEQKWNYNFTNSDTKITPELDLKIEGKIEIWIAKASFNSNGKIKADCYIALRKFTPQEQRVRRSRKTDFNLGGGGGSGGGGSSSFGDEDPKPKSYDVIYYHDGIKVYLGVDWKFGGGGMDANKPPPKFDNEWIVYDPVPKLTPIVLFSF